MTLRTSLVIDGDASGAAQAASVAAGGLNRLDAATETAAAATRAFTAAQAANIAVMRQSAQARQNLIFQLNDIGVSLASGMNPLMVAMQQGSQLATGPGGLGGALKELGNLAAGLATRFLPIGLAVGAVTAGIAGMQNAINSAGSSVQVSFGDTALGALQTLGDYIWDAIGPAITGIGQWFADAWNDSWPTIKNFGNMLVGTFAGAFDAMKSVWSSLPAVMGDIIYSAANTVLDGIQWLINSAIDRFNDLRHIVGLKDGDFGHVDLFKLNNPYAGAAANAGKEMADAFQNAMGTDYLGNMFSDIAARARENATKRLAEQATGTGAKGSKQAETVNLVTAAVKAQATAWDELSDVGGSAFDRLTDSILAGGKDIGETLRSIAADFAKTVFEMSITNPLKGFLGGALGSLVGTGGIGGLKSMPGIGGLTGTVRSFAGGGFTGHRARSGGLDGMGGFMAMLHPQETVTDHAAGGRRGGSQEVIRIVLQDDSGRMASIADQQIRTASGSIVELSVARSTARVEDKMAKGKYRTLGVNPGMRRT